MAALVTIVVSLMTLSTTKALLVVAIVSAVVFAAGRWKREIVPRSIRHAALLISAASVLALVVLHLTHNGGPEPESAPEPKSAPEPANEAKPGKDIRVYDKVTSGAGAMREDSEPIFLLTRPAALCGEGQCRIPGTKRETGGVYRSAVCQHRGEWVTNGDASSTVDDNNPGLLGSHRFYGVRLDQRTFGYVSEVWVSPKDRGGLDLPEC